MTEAAYYPVFVDLRSRTCVVLGDAPIADDTVTGLDVAGAVVDLLAVRSVPIP
jgi:hypothetical protein